MLVFSALLTTLGLALLCLTLGQSPLRALRGATVGAGFVLASLILAAGKRPYDRHLLVYVSLLCGLGTIILWRVDPFLASKQIMWMVLGLAAMLAVYFLVDDIKDLARLKYTAGFLAVGLLVLTMVVGHESHGARLWLGVPSLFMFQPGEVAKVLMCLFLAGYVAEKGPLIRAQVASRPGMVFPGLKYIGPLLLLVGFSLALFVCQRDLGAAALFFGLFTAITYLATGRKTYALLGLILFIGGMVGAAHFYHHVQIRLAAWTNPWQDPSGDGYQILQGLYALAAGGVTGTGLGNGFPELLPAQTAGTDMIFAVLGEELGLAGSFAVVLLFVLLTARSFILGWRSRQPFAALLAACLGTVCGLQTLVIIGGILRLIPLTGITLPFISYGGTSIVVNFAALGLLLVVSRDSVRPAEEP